MVNVMDYQEIMSNNRTDDVPENLIPALWLQSDLVRRIKTEFGIMGRGLGGSSVSNGWDWGVKMQVEANWMTDSPLARNIDIFDYATFNCHRMMNETTIMRNLKNKFSGFDGALVNEVTAFANNVTAEYNTTWEDWVDMFFSQDMDERRGNAQQKGRKLDENEMRGGKNPDEIDEVQWWYSLNNAGWSQLTVGGSMDGYYPDGETLRVMPMALSADQSNIRIACSSNNPFTLTPKTSFQFWNSTQIDTRFDFGALVDFYMPNRNPVGFQSLSFAQVKNNINSTCVNSFYSFMGPMLGWQKNLIFWDETMNPTRVDSNVMMPNPPTWTAEEVSHVSKFTLGKLGVDGNQRRNIWFLTECVDANDRIYRRYHAGTQTPSTNTDVATFAPAQAAIATNTETESWKRYNALVSLVMVLW
eukprot:scpid44693/ scgid8402/ 